MLIPHGSHTHLRLEGRGHLTLGLQLPLHCAADSNLSVQLLSSVPGGVCSLSGGPRSGAGLLASGICFGLGLLHVTLKLRTPKDAKGGGGGWYTSASACWWVCVSIVCTGACAVETRPLRECACLKRQPK